MRGGAVAAALAVTLLGSTGCGVSEPVPAAVGVGERYRPPPYGAAVRAARPLGPLACSAATSGLPAPRRFGVHLELFAHGRVILLPAGVGVAPPQRRHGAYVSTGRCSYPVRTLAPAGVVEVEHGRSLTLGALFALWGQKLGPTRLATFASAPGRRVAAFVDGRRWGADPRAIPMHRHVEIYLAVGRSPPPHTAYRFPLKPYGPVALWRAQGFTRAARGCPRLPDKMDRSACNVRPGEWSRLSRRGARAYGTARTETGVADPDAFCESAPVRTLTR